MLTSTDLTINELCDRVTPDAVYGIRFLATRVLERTSHLGAFGLRVKGVSLTAAKTEHTAICGMIDALHCVSMVTTEAQEQAWRDLTNRLREFADSAYLAARGNLSK